MKVSGKKVADAILRKLGKEIKAKNLKPELAIILAGSSPSSIIYIDNKIRTAKQYGIGAKLFEFAKNEKEKLIKTIDKLNKDPKVHGIIIQYPVYEDWDFDGLISKINPQKDVDGFLQTSPYSGAAALGVWEMLTAFSLLEGFKKTENFLKRKKIVVLGRGRAAGAPTIKLLEKKGFKIISIDKDTKNPTPKIKSGDIIISATGVKNIVNKKNLKKGVYVVGVGVGKEIIGGKERIYGDIKEDEVSEIAKLYCPTIGGIGPLTIACLLKNVVQSAQGRSPKFDLLEGKFHSETLTIGGRTKEELIEALSQGGFRVSKFARSLMENRDFVTLKEPEDIQIVRLKVRDLGLGGTATSDQIYERGRALGLELCPAEVGPHLRLKDTDQPLGSVYWIAMKQIVGRYGYPSVFGLGRGEGGLWLRGGWTEPTRRWHLEDKLVFSLRK